MADANHDDCNAFIFYLADDSMITYSIAPKTSQLALEWITYGTLVIEVCHVLFKKVPDSFTSGGGHPADVFAHGTGVFNDPSHARILRCSALPLHRGECARQPARPDKCPRDSPDGSRFPRECSMSQLATYALTLPAGAH